MRTQFSDAASSAVVGGPEPALQIDRSTGALLTTGSGVDGATATTAAALADETAMVVDAKVSVVNTTGLTIAQVIQDVNDPFWVRKLLLGATNASENSVDISINGIVLVTLSAGNYFEIPIPEGGRINTTTIRAAATNANANGTVVAVFTR